MDTKMIFDIDCRRCDRLATFLDQVKVKHPDYFARPVPSFGDPKARLLIVGLAPGMHGANATGRPFTGDHAGIMLYETLHRFGFGSRPDSTSATDRLKLKGCRITNAVKCLPPENKPTGAEIKICNDYLRNELATLPSDHVIIALGLIAHNAVLKALDMKLSAYRFGHAQRHQLASGGWLVDSYHCSRYNTQTKRLTQSMFDTVFSSAQELLA